MTNFKKIMVAGAATLGAALLVILPALAQPYMRVVKIATGVSAPSVLTVTSTVVTTVFGTNLSTSLGQVVLRTVQNTGTTPVLYTIGITNVSASSYHGVLAGGATTRDGLGSVLDLSKVPYPVTFLTESGSTTLAVVELTQ